MRTSSILILLHALFATATAARGKMTNLRELRKKDKPEDRRKSRKGPDDKFGKKNGRINPFQNTIGKRLGEVRPRDVGQMHSTAFRMLEERFDPEPNTHSSMRMMRNVTEIMNEFCDEGDTMCASHISKATVLAFQQEHDASGVLVFPDSMDHKIKTYLELTQTVIKGMDGTNTEESITMMDAILNDLENMKDVNTEYQDAAVASVSVAIESTKLWSNVLEDENHPFHNMVLAPEPVSADGRRLQINGEVSNAVVNVTVEVNYDIIIDNIQENVVSAVTAALGAVESVVNLVNVVIVNMVNLSVETIATTVEAVRGAVQGVVDAAVQVVVTVKDLGKAVAQGVVQVAGQAVDTTVAVANATVQAGITVATTVATVAVETVETGVDATVALANATIQAAGAVVGATVDVAIAIGGAAVETVVETVQNVAETVQDVAETVVDAVEEVVETVADVFSSLSRIVDADFSGASNGSAAMVNLMVENPTYLFPTNWLPMSVVVAFWYAFPASAASAFRNTLT